MGAVEGGVDRMGPMAGEFDETFGLGDDPGTIGHVDADGVALAAIQGLSTELDRTREQLDGKDERIETLETDAEKDAHIAELERETARIDELEARLTALEVSPATATSADD